MALVVGARTHALDPLRSSTEIGAQSGVEVQIPEALAPVTYVPSRPSAVAWLGTIGETIRGGFRKMAAPAAASVVACSLLLSGCMVPGGPLQRQAIQPPAASVQHAHVDLDAALAELEARPRASHLATLLREKMADPKQRAELASLDGPEHVFHVLQMEHHTKNYATPVIGIFIDRSVATQTEHGGRWDEDKNRAFTVHKLGPNNSIDILLYCPVSGHAKDHYPDELYQRHTRHSRAPSDDHERMRANAEIYSHTNSHYVYLTDDPNSYEMGRIVVADVKANGRYVTPVRVHLEGLQPGKAYEVRWSPFVGDDPQHPIVTHHGFKNGRSFRLIIPTDVAFVR